MLIELLPNCRGPLITDFCLRLGYMTIAIGTLGFLGLGLPPPTPDWGGMVKQGTAMLTVYPHMSLYPCFALVSLGARVQSAGRRAHRTFDDGLKRVALLSIRDLRVEYRTAAGRLVVIPDFSLEIEPGESFGLVGESGCGKSTLLMAIMGYIGRNGAIAGGRILFEGPIWSEWRKPNYGAFGDHASPSCTRNPRPP